MLKEWDSSKYLDYKDTKEVVAYMKNNYNTPNKEVAATGLDDLGKIWVDKYIYIKLSWKSNWDDLTIFFQLPLEIRIKFLLQISLNTKQKSHKSTQN